MIRVKQWYDRPMPADWKLGEVAWEWHCYSTRGLLRFHNPAPEVPAWPGVDGAPKPTRKTIAEKLAPKPPRPAKPKGTPMRGLPWGCKTAEEYGREYRRRQDQQKAQEAAPTGPVLRKRLPPLGILG